MNLTNFLKQTDNIIAQYSAEQLISFVHDIARILPEHYREDFLKRLKDAGGEIEKQSAKDTKDEDEFDFDKMYKLVKDNLKTIDSQEVEINGVWNEEYDEWYNDDSEEFYYTDDNGISDMLAKACDFVHVCMDMERYNEGFQIGNQIFAMEILCVSEYDDQEISIQDLVYHELLHCNLKQVLLDTAYCAYHAIPLKKRSEILYRLIVNADEDEITLEAIMQHGDKELPDFQDFLTLWITYLGTKTEEEADRLILEAVGLLDNTLAEARYAEQYVVTHPGLYLNILENGKYTNMNDMVSLGMKAIKIIPRKYIMRSRVALKTAEYIIEVNGNSSLLEKCYFAAYESDTSALNYLRALLNGYRTEKKKEELQEIFMTFSIDKSSSSYSTFETDHFYSERKENKPDSNMILLLKFLDGQFMDVLEKGLNESKALGWSGTFMKQGIALYLLYLYEGEGIGKGITKMISIVKSAMNFSAEEYQKGIYKRNNANNAADVKTDCLNENELFCKLFLEWKSMLPIDSGSKNYTMKKIEGLLEKRVEAIMSANRRNYYGECAAYIAALGEVKEALGEKGAKQKYMTSYKDKYSRRSAFREEMRNYGWIDVNRK